MRVPVASPAVSAVKTHARPVTRAMWRAWQQDRVSGLAAEVAFWGLLSLFPMLLAVAAALGSLQVVVGNEAAEDAREEVVSWLEEVLTEDASDTIDAVEELFASGSPGLLTVGALGAVWAASRGFAAVIRALDVAYNLEETRGYVRNRVLAVAMVFGSVLVGAVLLAVLVVGPLLGSGRELADRYDLGEAFAVLWTWVRWPLGFASVVAWATTLLHIAPNHKTPWRWDLPGAVLTTITWVLFSFGFRFYLEFAGDANQVFGLLGGSLITLVWMYLLALGLLVGGELNAVLLQLGLAPGGQPPDSVGSEGAAASAAAPGEAGVSGPAGEGAADEAVAPGEGGGQGAAGSAAPEGVASPDASPGASPDDADPGRAAPKA